MATLTMQDSRKKNEAGECVSGAGGNAVVNAPTSVAPSSQRAHQISD